jgi:hypothetical protein
MIRITEKDLYKFVFYPEEIPEEKYEYILSNCDLFDEQLELLKKIKLNQKNPLSEEILEQIKGKIQKRKNDNVTLYKDTFMSKSGFATLAAKSPEMISEINSSSFRDSENSYLIKLNTTKTRTKLYLFTNEDYSDRKFELKFNPSGKVIKFSQTDLPIEIEPIENINEIIITKEFI